MCTVHSLFGMPLWSVNKFWCLWRFLEPSSSGCLLQWPYFQLSALSFVIPPSPTPPCCQAVKIWSTRVSIFCIFLHFWEANTQRYIRFKDWVSICSPCCSWTHGFSALVSWVLWAGIAGVSTTLHSKTILEWMNEWISDRPKEKNGMVNSAILWLLVFSAAISSPPLATRQCWNLKSDIGREKSYYDEVELGMPLLLSAAKVWLLMIVYKRKQRW